MQTFSTQQVVNPLRHFSIPSYICLAHTQKNSHAPNAPIPTYPVLVHFTPLLSQVGYIFPPRRSCDNAQSSQSNEDVGILRKHLHWRTTQEKSGERERETDGARARVCVVEVV